MNRKALIRRTLDCATRGDRDRVAACLERVYDSGAVQHYVDTIIRYLDVADARLLDVGSGAAWHAPFLFAHGARAVHCLDKYVDLTTRSMRAEAHGGESFTLTEMPLTLGEFLGAFADMDVVVEDICDLAERDGHYDAATLLR
jgi:hypothetical protein